MKNDHEAIYCPYTDKFIAKSESTFDHIIPKSLGGIDALGIRCSNANSKIGTQIEGPLSRDFFLTQARVANKIRGQSKKIPEYIIKRATLDDSEKIARISMSPSGVKIWDPITKQPISSYQSFKFKDNIYKDEFIHQRARMLAKIALGYGYLKWGENFRELAAHQDLRHILWSDSIASVDRSIDVSFDIPIFRIIKDDPRVVAMEGTCNAAKPRSSIGIMPKTGRITIFCGLIGNYIGSICFRCNTDQIWTDHDNRYGDFCFIEKGELVKIRLDEAFRRVIYSLKEKDAWTKDAPRELHKITEIDISEFKRFGSTKSSK